MSSIWSLVSPANHSAHGGGLLSLSASSLNIYVFGQNDAKLLIITRGTQREQTSVTGRVVCR